MITAYRIRLGFGVSAGCAVSYDHTGHEHNNHVHHAANGLILLFEVDISILATEVST